MTDNYEDVPGAAEAARATLAHDYAMRRLAAQLDDTAPELPGKPNDAASPAEIRALAIQSAEHGAQYAGLSLGELDTAELEIRRLYFNEPARRYLLAIARQHLALLQASQGDGAGPDAEAYQRDEGMPL